jgi:rhodanese-related sulfurtransferase
MPGVRAAWRQHGKENGMSLAVRGVRTIIQWGMLLVLGCALTTALAAEPADVSPPDIQGVARVSAEDVFRLFETTPGLVIVDSRLANGPSSGRAQGFIEGSISLPDTETDCKSLAQAVPKKETPTLFYCNGPKCGRSAKAITVARACGYRNLYWFRGGFEEWREKGYPYARY